MNSVKNITKLFLVFLLTGFMVMLVANEAFYKHTHQINGQIIVHSHPYNTSSDSSSASGHQHNKAQVVFWDTLQLLFPILAFALLFVNISKPLSRSVQSTLFVYTAPQVHYPGRAPPAS